MPREELLALPVTIDLVTAARALGMGRSKAYELERRGEFPVPVLSLGNRKRVVTEHLLTLLGVDRALPEAPLRVELEALEEHRRKILDDSRHERDQASVARAMGIGEAIDSIRRVLDDS